MNLAKKAGWAILFGCITFLGTELGLRFLRSPSLQYYRDLKVLHTYHPDYYVALEPNQSIFVRHFAGKWEGHFSTNSLGLRGSSEPIPNKPKLLCLGDSLVMGFGVSDEDTFCSLLDGIELKGGARQALNLGVDAYGSLGSFRRMKEMVNRLDSVKEVLFIISPNDFTMPKALADQGILPDDEIDLIRERDPSYKRNFRIQFELTSWSYALQALKLAWEQLRISASVTKIGIEKEIRSAGLSSVSTPEETFGKYLLQSFYRPPKRKDCSLKELSDTGKVGIPTITQTCPEPVPAGIVCAKSASDPSSLASLPELTQKSYESMILFSKEKGFRLIPVIVPMQIEEIFCYQNGGFHELENYAIRASTFFEKRGVRVMQLKKDTLSMCGIDPEGKPKKILDHYIPEDGHFTKIGNRWAADAIAKHLKESGFAL
ncbi:lipase [Leptospira perolatii]|uniref:Lipase n=1 Tax=Leptospira perolatii TaxID=2023191 RepID=A0A2M9ZMN6_9LEPT|nr:lipase [Leptospira perolatii]PJZ70116.1 lipase [Leptospira perolatii]PJZ73305.1 lipase [Leptospira perolatii]